MTPEMIDQIAGLRGRGWSYRRIGRHLGVSSGAVSWNCLKEGIESPRSENKVLPQIQKGPSIVKRGNHVVRKFTQDEDARLRVWGVEGVRIGEMCKRLGRRHNSVKGRLMTLARHDERRESAREAARPGQQ